MFSRYDCGMLSNHSSSQADAFREITFSSKAYFQTLLNLNTSYSLIPVVSETAKTDTETWISELLAGFVSSADTGNEDLVIASRAALSEYCEASPDNLNLVCSALLHNLKTHQGQDRVVVPTLEIIAFLFHIGLFQQSKLNLRSLCLQTQKAGYKTGNIKKIEACIKVYGGVAGMSESPDAAAGVEEARKRLGALLHHPWTRVRSLVTDELWSFLGEESGNEERLKGVDWGQASKSQIKMVVEELRL